MGSILLQLVYSSALQAQKLRKNANLVAMLPWRRAVEQLRNHLVSIGAWR